MADRKCRLLRLEKSTTFSPKFKEWKKDSLKSCSKIKLTVKSLCRTCMYFYFNYKIIIKRSCLIKVRKVLNHNKTNSSIKPNKFHSNCVCFSIQKTREYRKICLKIASSTSLRVLWWGPRQLLLARSFHPQLWLVLLKFEVRCLTLTRFSGLCRTWQKRHWLLRKCERMGDRKPAEVSLLSFHFASSWKTSARRE